MKFQVLLLISLACFSAFAQTFADFQPVGAAVEIDGVSFQVGKDTNECGVRRTEGTDVTDYPFTASAASADTCAPKGIFQTRNGVWVILQSDGTQPILSDNNLLDTTDYEYSEVVPVATGRTLDEVVVVAKINTDADDFGKFTAGAFLGSVKADGTTFGGLEVSEIDVCKNVIRIEVTTPTDDEVVGANGAAIADATGDLYLSFDTANAGVSVSETLEECEEEEEEEEEEEDNSAGILSVASALLAVVGAVAL